MTKEPAINQTACNKEDERDTKRGCFYIPFILLSYWFCIKFINSCSGKGSEK